MVLKVYISGMSGNKEVKKRQQRVLMILDSKNIKYEIIDITEPGRETDKEFMQTKSTSNGATVSDPEPRHALPPQIFNDDGYCGDYDAFDLANEIDTLEQFLKLEPSPDVNTNNNVNTLQMTPIAATDSTNEQIETKQENGEINGEDNKENDGSEPNKDDEIAEKPENHNNEQKISVEESINIDPKSIINIETEMSESNEQISGDQDNEEQYQKLALGEKKKEIVEAKAAPTISTTDDVKEITKDDNVLDDKNTNTNKHEKIIEPHKKDIVDSNTNSTGSIVMAEKKIIKKANIDTKLQDNLTDLNDIKEMCNAEEGEKFQAVSSDTNLLKETIDNNKIAEETKFDQYNDLIQNVELDDAKQTKDNEKPLNTIDNDINNDKILEKWTDNDNDVDEKDINEDTQANTDQKLTTPLTTEKNEECNFNKKNIENHIES